MLNTDAAIAAYLPAGDGYTTEVGDLLFSLQALLIREAEGGRVDSAFAASPVPVEQPRWALDELPPSPDVVEAPSAPAVMPEPVATSATVPEPEIVAEPAVSLEPEVVPEVFVTPEPEIVAQPEIAQPAIALELEPHQVADVTTPPETSSPSPSWIVEPEAHQPVLFDPSTGAPTMDALLQEIERHGSRVSGSLVALDVTPIGDIRAQHGDATADAILRAIVEAVPFALRAEDQVYRTGTDELTLCVPGAGLSDAAVMGLRLQMAVKDVLVRRELPSVILSIRPYQQVAA
jgi:GGDEF domain-containing protein